MVAQVLKSSSSAEIERCPKSPPLDLILSQLNEKINSFISLLSGQFLFLSFSLFALPSSFNISYPSSYLSELLIYSHA
jgi:hypothetical protein